MAYSRATDLTILMPGALQVLAALLHGVQTIYTYDNKEPTVRGSLDLAATQVAQATIVFQQALLPQPTVVRPATGLPRRVPSRQGEALTSRLSCSDALDKGGNC